MSQKQMLYASLLTILLVLLPAFFQLSGMIIVLQLIIALIIGFILKPRVTFIPTIGNLLIYMIIQAGSIGFSNGNLSNIFLTSVFGFNISYIFSSEAMAVYLKNKPDKKFLTKIKAFILGLAISVLIGMTYYLIIM